MRFPPDCSCDCHVHVIGPKAQFPLRETRAYTPMDATCTELVEQMARTGVARSVLIQTSVFGTDNSCLLDGLRQLGAARARGVVVPEPAVATVEQDHWHTLGVRGVRLNLTSGGTPSLTTIRQHINSVLPICERNGWHLQFFLPAAVISAIAVDLSELPVPCVLDHFGLLSLLDERSQHQLEHEAAILNLLETGKLWVKLSGTYRIADDRHHPGIGALARRLHQTNPQRTLWASDWPHTPAHVSSAADGSADEAQPYRGIDSRLLLAEFAEWFADADDQHQILVANPAELYCFDT